MILDLTGVATIDSASVDHLGRIHRAIRLLGSECMFSGISGQTAALMTEISQDLANWKTFANVRQALGASTTASRNSRALSKPPNK
ncbi:MAG TPA: STAS domain-containing protein [Polyangium sp.]|nr:STAS domain-containing protein [Polyangium sp.]